MRRLWEALESISKHCKRALRCNILEQLQQIDLPLFPFHFFSIQGINVEKTYSSRLIFHLSFPFIFSQSPIISLQSPIKKGDITSPFPYRKGENQSVGALLPYMLKLRKRISLYGEKKKRKRSICWSCSKCIILI